MSVRWSLQFVALVALLDVTIHELRGEEAWVDEEELSAFSEEMLEYMLSDDAELADGDFWDMMLEEDGTPGSNWQTGSSDELRSADAASGKAHDERD